MKFCSHGNEFVLKGINNFNENPTSSKLQAMAGRSICGYEALQLNDKPTAEVSREGDFLVQSQCTIDSLEDNTDKKEGVMIENC